MRWPWPIELLYIETPSQIIYILITFPKIFKILNVEKDEYLSY